MLTAKDLQKIGSLVDERIDQKFQSFKEQITEQISHLPTKEEFNARMDEMIGILKKTDEEQILQSSRLAE